MASFQHDLREVQCRSSYSSRGEHAEFPGVALWRKSSYSNGDGGHCVELATNLPHLIPVRDSKLPADTSPTLLLTPTAWTPFLASLKESAP
ncbi:DUF397 domain-containing protein [Streptomyces acidiscabies]|uniref:DUF397 domain-containing protein n=1 Tax=Streptomyces acidiscabies TaxID=42234 RepID=UPI0038F690EA